MKITSRTQLNSGIIRYRLTNEWFIDRYIRHGYGGAWKYEVWMPGAGRNGIAASTGGADTLKEALALAAHVAAGPATAWKGEEVAA